ncbi:hypothetical protein LTR70_009227, partial [Exophiala xenobiotica]
MAEKLSRSSSAPSSPTGSRIKLDGSSTDLERTFRLYLSPAVDFDAMRTTNGKVKHDLGS